MLGYYFCLIIINWVFRLGTKNNVTALMPHYRNASVRCLRVWEQMQIYMMEKMQLLVSFWYSHLLLFAFIFVFHLTSVFAKKNFWSIGLKCVESALTAINFTKMVHNEIFLSLNGTINVNSVKRCTNNRPLLPSLIIKRRMMFNFYVP